MLKLGGSDYQGWCVDSASVGGVGHHYDAANLKQTAEGYVAKTGCLISMMVDCPDPESVVLQM